MLFNSYAFIFVFLPLVMAGFFLVGRTSHKGAALWLALASLVFYGWWNPRFVILVLVSILINYTAGYYISRKRNEVPELAKAMLTLAIVVDLGILAYYKYANFFIANVSQLAGIEFSALDIILPIGVSFFTFSRNMSPVEMWTSFVAVAMRCACVPLPAPGGPSRTMYTLANKPFVVAHQQLRFELFHGVEDHGHHNQEARG